MKILAIGAHFDDVELGCGGSLLSWKKEGHSRTIFTATRSGYKDPQGHIIRTDQTAREEGFRAAKFLGAELITADFPTLELEFSEPLNCKLIEVLQQVKPDLVLTHWMGDAHHDHRALALASLHCCRNVPKFLTYRVNWYEGREHFDPRFLVDISETLEQKIELIKIYESENHRTHETWLDFVQSQARTMGLKAGVRFAEGFEVIKWRM